jgi:hypothetical protein
MQLIGNKNNPQQIANDMSGMCGSQVSANSAAVNCALSLSKFENTLQGRPLFGNSTGIEDDMAQDRWCLGMGGSSNVSIPSNIQPSSC